MFQHNWMHGDHRDQCSHTGLVCVFETRRGWSGGPKFIARKNAEACFIRWIAQVNIFQTVLVFFLPDLPFRCRFAIHHTPHNTPHTPYTTPRPPQQRTHNTAHRPQQHTHNTALHRTRRIVNSSQFSESKDERTENKCGYTAGVTLTVKQMPRHLIGDAHARTTEFTTVPPVSGESTAKGTGLRSSAGKTPLVLTPVRLCEMT